MFLVWYYGSLVSFDAEIDKKAILKEISYKPSKKKGG